jgi:hypothetical protein
MALCPGELTQMQIEEVLASVTPSWSFEGVDGDVWDAVLDEVKAGKFPVDAAKFFDGFSLIHLAAQQNNVLVICALQKLGADMHKTTCAGLTPMHCCALSNFEDFEDTCTEHVHALTLLSIDNLVCGDVAGSTPLDYATEANNKDAVRWMLQQPTCTAEMKARARAQIPMRLGKKPQAMTAVFEEDRRWSSLRSGWLAAVVMAP